MAASADGSCAAISAAIRTVGPEWRLSPAIEFELQLAFASNLPVVPILGMEADLIQLTSETICHENQVLNSSLKSLFGDSLVQVIGCS